MVGATPAEVVALVGDGDAVATGGALTTRKPVALVEAIARAKKQLKVWTLLGSLDVEILAVRGALATVNSIYVGFEQLGGAPAFEAAARSGAIVVNEFSELALIGGLRATIAGIPFFPTRALRGSEVATELGLATVDCPYSGETLHALPAIEPDVAVIHAEAADREGNVFGSRRPYFLLDLDATIARAAARVAVSVERILDRAEARARRADVLLFGHEVDRIVHLPGGTWPTALPGLRPLGVEALRTYLAAAADGDPAVALDRLLA